MGGAHQGARQGVLGQVLHTGDLLPEHWHLDPGLELLAGDLNLALGQGAGLIQHHMINLRQGLQHPAVFHQHALTRPHAGGHGDGHGRGQAEGTGAGDNEYGGGGQKRRLHPLMPPGPEGERGDQQGEGDKPGHHAIGHALDGGLAGLGLLHQIDNLPQRGLGQGVLGLHQQAALAIEGAGPDLIADRLALGMGLTAQQGLIHPAATLQHQAIDGDLITGANAHPVTHLHRPDRQGALARLAHHPGGGGLQVQQPLPRRDGGLA